MKCLVLLLLINASCVLSVTYKEDNRLLYESVGAQKPLKVESSVVDKWEAMGEKNHDLLSEKDNNTGYASNCGDAKHKFILSWKPKIIRPSQGVVLKLDFIAATNFSNGTAHVSVATSGSPPFITDDLDLNCDIIRKQFPEIECPIKAGAHIQTTYIPPDLSALPEGTYTLKANVTTGKENFLCAKLVVTIQED